MSWEYLAIGLIGFLAFYMKGITGTGTGAVLVSLCTLVLAAKEVIVLKAFVAVLGGFAMLKIDPVSIEKRYWIPIAAFMAVGSALGAIALTIIDKDIFEIVLGCAFLIVSLWWLIFKTKIRERDLKTPESSNPLDWLISSICGFLGGFIGVNAPVLITWFSRQLGKAHLRRLLVLIFIPAALAETGTFIVTGLFTKQILLYGLFMIPFMAAGIYLGNKSFHKISETAFRRILGVFLLIASVKLIL